MGDGYSDKSVSPIVYQPAADNDPQADIDYAICDSMLAPELSIATTIAQTYPNLYRFVPVDPIPSTSYPPQHNSSFCERSDGKILAMQAIGPAIRLSKVDPQTGIWTFIGLTNGPITASAVVLRRLRGSYIFLMAGTTNYTFGMLSADDGETWGSAIYFINQAGIAHRGVSAMDTNGNFVVSAHRTIAGYLQPCCIRVTNYGETATLYDFPSVTGFTSSILHSQCPVLLEDGTILCASCTSTAGNVLIFKSVDNGITWSHIHTSAAATYLQPTAFFNGHYLGNNTALWFFYGTAGKFFIVSDSGSTITLKATPTAVTNFVFHVPNLADPTMAGANNRPGMFAFYGYAGSNAYAGIYFSSDYCDTFSKITTQAIGIPFVKSIVIPGSYRTLDTAISSGNTTVALAGLQLHASAYDKEVFATLPSFSVTSPAKLSAILTATAQLVTAGKSGTVKLYLQHTNDAVTTASSLADVAGAWTDCGALTHDTPLSLPSFTARAGEVIYPRIGFTCTDVTGVSPAPELSSIAFSWSSDVTAPGEPTVTRIVNTSGSSSYGYRVDFGALPAGSRHLIVEGRKNSGGYLPFNTKAQWASGEYMKLRGSRDAVEEAGERNETSLSSNTGFVKDDTAQVKVAAEDDVGNRSAFVESAVITMADSSVPYVPVLTRNLTARLRKRLTATIRR